MSTAYAYHRRQRGTPDAMVDPGRRRPPGWVAEVLGTVWLPDSFSGDLSARFRPTGLDGNPLLTDLWKVGGLHAFLGRLTAEAYPVPRLSYRTLLGVDQDGGSHILHLLCSVSVGPYNPDRRLFGCRGEIPPDGLPTITEIPVDYFGALRAVSAMSRDDHQVHLYVFPPSV